MSHVFVKSLLTFALTLGMSVVLMVVVPLNLAWSAEPVNLNGATITGKITLNGMAPKPKTINMRADPACADKHDAPVLDEALAIGPGNVVKNVLISIRSGLSQQAYPIPEEPVVLNQSGCVYQPRVVAMRAGQTLRIENPDGISHNVRAVPRWNQGFNFSMSATARSLERKIARPEIAVLVKCDIHPWMRSFVAALPNPFFDVTGAEGMYTITGLGAGTYEIEAWHETLGTQVTTVTVGDDQTTVTANFTFNGK
ncbi:MAG: hypothetical protein HY647_02405 [Acidobacteria bacterium]|nr:hypothetical protein [Acidobacteriota bacterium]